jgi:hypothetical protein
MISLKGKGDNKGWSSRGNWMEVKGDEPYEKQRFLF